MASSSSLRNLRRLSSSVSISKVKAKIKSERDPDKALKIYSSVSQSNASPTLSRFAQDITVRRLASSGRLSDIETFIESHKSDPKIKDETFLSNLIRSYGLAGMFDKALRTFDQMDTLGTPRSALSFNALLTACNNSKLFNRVPRLFHEIPNTHNLVPNQVSYGILINSYCKNGVTEKAIETIKLMEEKNIDVTPVSITTIVDALYKEGKTKSAEDFWEEMKKKKGSEIDTEAYNVVIGHCHGDDPEKVKAFIEEMTESGFEPNTVTYNFLMTCYCKKGLIEDARKVYDGLRKKGLNPNLATFRTLIYYLCKEKDFDRAHKVFKRSFAANKIPDFTTMKALVEGLTEKRKISDAKWVLGIIKNKFPPNVLVSLKNIEEKFAPGKGAVP